MWTYLRSKRQTIDPFLLNRTDLQLCVLMIDQVRIYNTVAITSYHDT